MRIKLELQVVDDAFARAYRAWLKKTGAVPGPSAFVLFHKHRGAPEHDLCNFCHS